MHWLFLLAEGEPQPPVDFGGSLLRSPMIPMLLMLGVIFIMSMRTSARQRRELQDMLSKMKKNDRVQTSAGIIGYIVQIKDDDTVVLKSGDDTNSRLMVLRSTIVKILTEPGAENKPAT